MKKVDRWLLPEGIEELFPSQAGKTESLRRRLIDTFGSWGYDYVVPPMVEFTDSLLTGSGSDVDLLTFKITDQLTGKTMGIRADATPQVARMDAHSLDRKGINRLCYSGHVMHAKPKSPLASRIPLQAGVELFGEDGLDADVEVISLLLQSLSDLGLSDRYLDVGHVGIFRALAKAAKLDKDHESRLFALLQAKAMTDLSVWLEQHIEDITVRSWFSSLAQLSGDDAVLDKALDVFSNAPKEVSTAINDLRAINTVIKTRFPDANVYYDLSELRGYHYLTGVVFGAFASGVGSAIANGGRYDHVGESFGKARPATGFAINITALARVLENSWKTPQGIFVPSFKESEKAGQSLWQKISELRKQGERVVTGLAGQTAAEQYQHCDRVLVDRNGEWLVEKI